MLKFPKIVKFNICQIENYRGSPSVVNFTRIVQPIYAPAVYGTGCYLGHISNFEGAPETS